LLGELAEELLVIVVGVVLGKGGFVGEAVVMFGAGLGVVAGAGLAWGGGYLLVPGDGRRVRLRKCLGIGRILLLVSGLVVFGGALGLFDKAGEVVDVVFVEGVEHCPADFVPFPQVLKLLVFNLVPAAYMAKGLLPYFIFFILTTPILLSPLPHSITPSRNGRSQSTYSTPSSEIQVKPEPSIRKRFFELLGILGEWTTESSRVSPLRAR
jgi:hypothetical protein